tara:strand:- start:670 stop:948 length:279 start_codon:yes stop_codon:yes gene_type:complete
MAFLDENRKNRVDRNTRKNRKNDLVLEPEAENVVIYFFAVLAYFVRRNIGKILLILIALYIIYSRFRKREETEMIDGMEVPKLKDNYDLSLD